MRRIPAMAAAAVLLIVGGVHAAELTLMGHAKGDSLSIGVSDVVHTNGHTLTIGTGGLSIDGILNAGASEIQCAGSWMLGTEGTFATGTSTVVLNGAGQTLSGSTTFYRLRKTVTQVDMLRFDHEATQTVTDTLELQGSSDSLLSLRSTLDGDAFGFIHTGSSSQLTLAYLDVKDADATGGNTLTTTSSVDSGNNTHWSFVDAVWAAIRAWLEGPYQTDTHQMHTALNDDSLVPLDSPYAEAPAHVTQIDADVVDWVLVELRTAADGPAVLSRSLFLQSDGDIVDASGNTPEIPSLSPGDYFVVLRHRNHLAAMSKVAHTFVSRSEAANTLDLTNLANVYGTNGVKLLEADVWGLYTGDADGNGQVQTQDKNDVWWPNVGTQGYKACDLNLDCQVQTSDKNDCWWPNVGIGTQVPGT